MTRQVSSWSLAIATITLLLAFWLSSHALSEAGRFHPDEAFYMAIARNAAIKGDWWLLSEPLDKPPLTFYLNALSIHVVAADSDAAGVLHLDALRGELAGRLPSLWLHLIAIAVAIALARRFYRDRFTVYASGLLLAVSPFLLAFAPTSFTDMPMLTLALLALLSASRRQWTLAGVWFGLSLAAKPQSVFYLPLLALLFLWAAKTGGEESRSYSQSFLQDGIWRDVLRFLLPVISIAGLILAWDAVRIAQGADSFLSLGQARYTPTRITPPAEIPSRLMTWWQSMQWSFGGLLTALLFGVAGFAGVAALYRTVTGALHRTHRITLLLAGWTVGFIGMHLLLTLNLFDRNQLLLLPVMALLIARGLWRLCGTRMRYGVLCLMIGLMLPTAYTVQTLPIGGDDGSHDGVHRLADYLNTKPVATVIYDRWLDWELDYYMGAWTDKRRVYYPTPAELTAGALALPERDPRYLVAPLADDVPRQAWLDALRDAGFTVRRDAQIAGFVVYQVLPPRLDFSYSILPPAVIIDLSNDPLAPKSARILCMSSCR